MYQMKNKIEQIIKMLKKVERGTGVMCPKDPPCEVKDGWNSIGFCGHEINHVTEAIKILTGLKPDGK